jgi:hypothetical protein
VILAAHALVIEAGVAPPADQVVDDHPDNDHADLDDPPAPRTMGLESPWW